LSLRVLTTTGEVVLVPGLTSLALVFLLAGLVTLLLIGVLWGWPKLGGSGIRPIVARLAALCALQASVLSLAFVLVNRSGGFYSSWSDMFGRYTGGGQLVTLPEAAGRPSALVSVRATVPVRVPARVPGKSQPGGILESVVIRGQLSGLTATGYVYLPPGYPRSARSGAGYPVVVAVTGAPRDSTSPYGAARLAAAAAAQIAGGRMQPLILVTLPAGTSTDPGCLNVPGGAQDGVFFGQDLPAAIGASYRVSAGPGGWALLGDASGGYCALQLALTNAATYSAAALPPAPYQAPPGPPAWDGSRQLRLQANLNWLLRHEPMQPVSVLFTGAGQGHPLLSLVRAPMRAESTPLAGGPSPLGPVLSWLGQVLKVTTRWS
jgi:hypothetical protein